MANSSRNNELPIYENTENRFQQKSIAYYWSGHKLCRPIGAEEEETGSGEIR